MRPIAALLLSLLALLPQPLAAQVLPYDFDAEPGGERLVELHDPIGGKDEADAEDEAGAETGAAPAAARSLPSAGYGPFRILDETRAALAGITDAGTPAAFAAMLRDHPGIVMLELVDCPGTEDDRANLRLGLMIRARGIATHVPEGGWVASGAVELFLAGAQRSAEAGARFAVHSWEDDAGRGPGDYAPDAPKNRAYIDYYRAMGMSAGEARAFYAMTNATPFSHPRQFTAAEMAQWARFDRPAAWPAPRGTLAAAF